MSGSQRFTFAPVEPDGDQIKVYLPSDLRDDFVEFLEANGVQTTDRIELAFGIDDAIIGILVAGGGFAGISAILTAYFGRNKDKRLVVKTGDLEVDITGMSTDEMGTVLENVIGQVAEQQREADESWHRILEEMPDPPKHLPPASDDQSR